MMALVLLGLMACRQVVTTNRNHVKIGIIQSAEHVV